MQTNNLHLDTGTYDLIRNRLEQQALALQERLTALNKERKVVFGAVETSLIANDRIHTDNYCTARDMVAIGEYCLFGYNVHIGLRSGISLADVFSVYRFAEQRFVEADLQLLKEEKFLTDFQNLYRYYKDAFFARFARHGQFLHMVFHLNAKTTDFKTFKWLVTDEGLQYVDNRSDHEVQFPDQYEFRWRLATRDDQRNGKHPHVSILDRVFVETVGGDLTIKVEDNTEDGLGIYREPVDYPDQTLDDAEFAYADLGNLIALRIRPYQEEARYFVFNDKVQQVQRVDSLGRSGVLLPEGQGLIFANGYYLQTAEYKLFDQLEPNLVFKKRIAATNGEDYLFVFYNNSTGMYVLLPYNIIAQEINTPIVCSGFTLFPGGELCYFRAEEEATRHHVMQIWQTAFTSVAIPNVTASDNYLFKIGNKDIVRAMAECQEVLTLCRKEDSYLNLYEDLVKRSTDVLDAYYWIRDEQAGNLAETLVALRETAETAVEEYAKKVAAQRQTQDQLAMVARAAEASFDKIRRESFRELTTFVEMLAQLRQLRGDILGLKELPFTDLALVEELENQAQEANVKLGGACVTFLLAENALEPYQARIGAEAAGIRELTTAKDAHILLDTFDEISGQLELLVEMVTNLKIEDATHTTKIIDSISVLFTSLNQHRAAVKQVEKQLQGQEAGAEFAAQIKLLDQSVINYLDLADTPARCDEFLTKLMVQLEELESKFAEVDEYLTELTEKRESIFAALESRKNSLVEARNNRTTALEKAANRILTGIQKRASSLSELAAINSFFAADLMVEKVRDLIQQLHALEDSNKAQAVQTTLKTLQEEAVRSLRDRQELFVNGQDVIQLGRHRFTVNVQPLALTVVHEGDQLRYHLTGTSFYQNITDEALLAQREVWQQNYVSENQQVYRGAYLAYQVTKQTNHSLPHDFASLLPIVTAAAAKRFDEGYTKGIHDEDAARLLAAYLPMEEQLELTRYSPPVRALAKLWWTQFVDKETKASLHKQIDSAAHVIKVFPETTAFVHLQEALQTGISAMLAEQKMEGALVAKPAATYLLEQLVVANDFVISARAAALYQGLVELLKQKKAWGKLQQARTALAQQTQACFSLMRQWVLAFLEATNSQDYHAFVDEVAALLLCDDYSEKMVNTTFAELEVESLRGDHPTIVGGTMQLDYHSFQQQLLDFSTHVVPAFRQFVERKRALTQTLRQDLQLHEFEPKVMSSFVRNRLIDQVYLPLIGDNLAKQLGTVGEQTRTDRMGMLLLISPPGYGKTTLMEYVANRLGLIFVKVNGPALGHEIRSLAPQDAPSMAARKELEKLNLALEMGDNIMLYVDDIQHCNAEFLQKFISLCDAQRKIEGVFNGKAKTYDLRGRRACIVMAGNPYTETGTRFEIPDMLANRADIYNLGDIIGDSAKAFKLSYLENALISNPALAPLANQSRKDVHSIINGIEMAQLDNLQLEGTYSGEELRSYTSILTKMLHVRDVVLRVNQAYIESAAMTDAYRTEPAFKLQGSYRNMNKLAEKIAPIMNDAELETLLLSHYEGEVQTLTSNAEANYLKLKELLGLMSEEEELRWESIKATFVKQQRFGSDDQMGQLLAQLDAVGDGLEGIRLALVK